MLILSQVLLPWAFLRSRNEESRRRSKVTEAKFAEVKVAEAIFGLVPHHRLRKRKPTEESVRQDSMAKSSEKVTTTPHVRVQLVTHHDSLNNHVFNDHHD